MIYIVYYIIYRDIVGGLPKILVECAALWDPIN